jgi:hypothetical protein
VLLLGATRQGRDQRVTSVTCSFGKVREKDPDDWPGRVEYVVSKSGGIKICSAGPEDQRPLKEQIVTRLELGVPLTKFALRQKLGRHAQDVEAAITELFKERRIFTVESNVRGKIQIAYQLRADGTQESRERGAKLVEGLTRLRGTQGVAEIPEPDAPN